MNVERLAYALALVGPVDLEDTDEAWREYAKEVFREYMETPWPSVEWDDDGPRRQRDSSADVSVTSAVD